MSCVLVGLGYSMKGKADIFRYTGFAFLFILGLMLIPYTPFGSVEIETGTTVASTVGGYVIDYTLEDYQNFRFGFFMAVLGSLGFVSTFMSRQEVSDYE